MHDLAKTSLRGCLCTVASLMYCGRDWLRHFETNWSSCNSRTDQLYITASIPTAECQLCCIVCHHSGWSVLLGRPNENTFAYECVGHAIKCTTVPRKQTKSEVGNHNNILSLMIVSKHYQRPADNKKVGRVKMN